MTTDDSVTLFFLYSYLRRCNPSSAVHLGERGQCGAVTSWRGAYEHLSLCPAQPYEPYRTVVQLVGVLREYIGGKKYEGYKGGDYFADKDTRVYADACGEYTEHAIVGAHEMEDAVYLHIWEPISGEFTKWSTLAEVKAAQEIEEKQSIIHKLTLEIEAIKHSNSLPINDQEPKETK